MIGIYGGSFDPIHYGHLRSALEIQQQLPLSELRFMPCQQSPLKSASATTAAQRLAMLQLAIADEPQWSIETLEIQRGGLSYTVDSLAILRAELGETPLLLLIGNDALSQLPTWHRWQQLFDYAHIVVMTRPNTETVSLSEFLQAKLSNDLNQLRQQAAGKLFFQTVTGLAISATKLRQLHAQGRSVRFLLPESVIDYIKNHQLYLSTD
jgi:nicotinate-nucleotide adenylyltransferase